MADAIIFFSVTLVLFPVNRIRCLMMWNLGMIEFVRQVTLDLSNSIGCTVCSPYGNAGGGCDGVLYKTGPQA